MTMRVFTLQNALFIFVGLRLVVLITETFERLRILFILWTITVHSCFTSCIFAAWTLDFAVKFPGADTGGVDRVDIHPPFFSKKKFEMSLYLK